MSRNINRELEEAFVEEFIEDFERMVSLDGNENFVIYRPDAQRRIAKFYRDYNTLRKFGVDTRGRAF